MSWASFSSSRCLLGVCRFQFKGMLFQKMKFNFIYIDGVKFACQYYVQGRTKTAPDFQNGNRACQIISLSA